MVNYNYIDDDDIEYIIDLISMYFGVEKNEIKSRSVDRNISLIRKYIYYALHNEFYVSPMRMSKIFNRTDRGIKKRISEIKFLIENNRGERVVKNQYSTTYINIINELKKQGFISE